MLTWLYGWISTALIRFYHEANKKGKLNELINTLFSVNLIMSIVTLAVVLVISRFINMDSDFKYLLKIAAIYLTFELVHRFLRAEVSGSRPGRAHVQPGCRYLVGVVPAGRDLHERR